MSSVLLVFIMLTRVQLFILIVFSVLKMGWNDTADISTLLLIGWVAEWAGTPYHVPYTYFTFDFIIFGFYVLFNLFLFWYIQHNKVPYYFKMQI